MNEIIVDRVRDEVFNSVTKKKFTSEIEEKVLQCKKQRLQSTSFYNCDYCKKLISDPAKGFVIQGNIYNASLDKPVGLVGQNIPKLPNESVRKTVFCKNCLKKALGFKKNG